MVRARIRPENLDANLKSYYDTYRNFSWSEVETEFFRYQSGRINIVNEAIDRWASHPEKRKAPALVFEKAGKVESLSYLELKEISCRWANLLVEKGFETGDRLLIFLTVCPQMYCAMLACARLGVIFSTIFPTLGFDEVGWILRNSEPRVCLPIRIWPKACRWRR